MTQNPSKAPPPAPWRRKRQPEPPDLLPVIALLGTVGVLICVQPLFLDRPKLADFMLNEPVGFALLLCGFALYTAHRAAVIAGLVIHGIVELLLAGLIVWVMTGSTGGNSADSCGFFGLLLAMAVVGLPTFRLIHWLQIDARRRAQLRLRQGPTKEEEDLGGDGGWDESDETE